MYIRVRRFTEDCKRCCGEANCRPAERKEYVPVPPRAGVGNTARQYAVHYERKKQDGNSQYGNDARARLRYDAYRVFRR